MKILINLPDYRHIHGGVTNHFAGLRPHWKENVRYNIIGKRREGWSGLWWLPWDYLKFVFLLLLWRPDVVLVNPSMNSRAWPRDRMFLRIAQLLRRTTAVMFHGWTDSYFESVKADGKSVKILNRTACIFVLATEFKNRLVAAGVTAPIVLTTTKVSDEMLGGVPPREPAGKITDILFLARVIKTKGIFVVLDMFKRLAAEFPEATLTVAGDGEALDEARRYAADNAIPRVTFTGHVEPADVARIMSRSQIYVLPTHSEGMPTSVLEAMAFGLFVVTRPVGGLKDFFESGKMGILTESLQADDYYDIIAPLMTDPAAFNAVSAYNSAYSRSHFLASAVASEMECQLTEYAAK